MSQGRQKWPTVGAKSDTLKDHGDHIIADLTQITEYALAGTEGTGRRGKDIPATTWKPFFDSIQHFVQRAIRPDKNEIEQQRHTYTLIKEMHHNLTILKANSTTNNAIIHQKNASNTQTWAQIASSIAVPPSIQRTISGTSSAAASIESPKHKEIVIRYKGNNGVSEVWRKLRPAELVQRLNAALNSADHASVQTAKITAARINARGSIVAHAETAAQAEALRIHREEWQFQVSGEAEVMLPVYPVVMHGVPIQSVRVGDKQRFIDQLKVENQQIMTQDMVSDCRWYRKYKDDKKDGSLIIDCKTPEGANAIIKEGTLAWSHGLRPVRRHDPTSQFTRCLKCYQYGKCKGTFCTNSETCGKCASVEHNTGDCTSSEKKCCLCHGQHYAWSAQCAKYKDEVRRVELAKARLQANPFYSEPSRKVSPGPSAISSCQTASKTSSTENDTEMANTHQEASTSEKGATHDLTASQHAPNTPAVADPEGYIVVKPRKKKSPREPLTEVSGNSRKRRLDDRSRSRSLTREASKPKSRSKSTRRRESVVIHIDDGSDQEDGSTPFRPSGSKPSTRSTSSFGKAKKTSAGTQ